jgi:hypothetical protein
MKKNIGTPERVIRAIVGIGIMCLAFVGSKTPWAYLGVIPFLTGIVGFCPPYALLGIKTCNNCN